MNINCTFNAKGLNLYHGHYQDETFKEHAIKLPMIPPLHEEIEDVLMISWYQQYMVGTKSSSMMDKEDLSLMLHGSPAQISSK